MDVDFVSPELAALLAEELASGNRIAEVSDWPPECRKLVILEYRFSRVHDVTALEFREVNDPHYWFSEYVADGGAEVLACRINIMPR
jgi:hypothetical protein